MGLGGDPAVREKGAAELASEVVDEGAAALHPSLGEEAVPLRDAALRELEGEREERVRALAGRRPRRLRRPRLTLPVPRGRTSLFRLPVLGGAAVLALLVVVAAIAATGRGGDRPTPHSGLQRGDLLTSASTQRPPATAASPSKAVQQAVRARRRAASRAQRKAARRLARRHERAGRPTEKDRVAEAAATASSPSPVPEPSADQPAEEVVEVPTESAPPNSEDTAPSAPEPVEREFSFEQR
jgi:hypothetical protein